jgi:hypothetical protein
VSEDSKIPILFSIWNGVYPVNKTLLKMDAEFSKDPRNENLTSSNIE